MNYICYMNPFPRPSGQYIDKNRQLGPMEPQLEIPKSHANNMSLNKFPV